MMHKYSSNLKELQLFLAENNFAFLNNFTIKEEKLLEISCSLFSTKLTFDNFQLVKINNDSLIKIPYVKKIIFLFKNKYSHLI